MPFELYIWGPAFGLESIDPECLAAVAYLSLAAPQPGVWSIVPTSSSAVSYALPALRDSNTGLWVATGFDSIVAFAKKASTEFTDLDAGLTPRQTADAAAFSAFLRAEAAPLLALSLYVSSANWVATTRPAYSHILPFPLTWIEPPAIRESHAAATAHLGFSSLDTDRSDEDDHESSLVAALNSFPDRIRKTVGANSDKEPERLQAPKQLIPGANKTLAAALKKSARVSQALTPEAKAKIRLDEAARSFYSVLALQKGDQKLFLTESAPTSLDCLAYAYLSLMVVPDVPRPFLSDSLSKHYPDLANFATDMQQTCFVHGVVHSIPGLGGEWVVWLWQRVRLHGLEDDVSETELPLGPWRRSVAGARSRQARTIVGTLATTAVVVGLLLAYHRLPAFGSRTVVYQRAPSGLLGLGAAGAFLHAAF
ncbi:mitochondrial import receptor subunit [Ophiostoma piceae UAMH 11346]|uniref:Mitochondrial import receptor subunit n=1 Tax=Ophiostoma piceae (strain UAMH 11346) TaxID=1262450 RepID=S3CSE2_OPHP1|nr:mitochondrial import receptor subunit [Ophiostoma piceae UAMH 11346]